VVPPVANAVLTTVPYNAAATNVPLNITGGAPTSVAVGTPASNGTATATGIAITYQPTAGFAGSDSFTYTATNGAGTSAAATVTVTVSDPVITVSPSGGFAATVGAPYTQTFTWAGGAAPYSAYAVSNLPVGLSISASTANSATVSGTPTQAGGFTLNATATDSSTGNGPFTVGQTFVLTVASPTLALAPAAAAFNAPYGAAYSQAFSASGGIGPYTYAIAGTLPPGLSLIGGVVSGTPTAPGNHNFAITATDTGSVGAGAPFTLTQNYSINVAAPTIVVNPPPALPNPAVGAAYSQALAGSGGVGPYSFVISAGSLPGGIGLSGAGVLSGVANAVGNFTFTVTVTDANGQTGSGPYTLAVGAPTLILTPAATTFNLPYGVAYTQTFTASGSPGPFSYALTGVVPPGLSLTGNVLAGIPSAPGPYAITITATDTLLAGAGAPFQIAQLYSVVVAAPSFVLAPAALPNPTPGAPYSQTLTATGGVGPYSFAVTAGALPPGLTLGTGGVLSGLASLAGSFNFTVTATDANGQTGNLAYALAVAAVPSQSLVKALAGNADEDGSGAVSLNDTLTYRVTMSNTGNAPLANVVLNDSQTTPSSVTCANVLPAQTCVLQGSYRVTEADVRAGAVVNVATVSNSLCAAGSLDPSCRAALRTPVVSAAVGANDDNFGELVCPRSDVVAGNAYANDTLDGRGVNATDFVGTVVSGATASKPGKPVPELDTATGAVTVPAGTPGGDYQIAYRICERSNPGNCDSALILVRVQSCQIQVRVIKTAQRPQVQVGGFVSYTLQIENISDNGTEVEGLEIVDTPPPGFSLVPGSARFQDEDKTATVQGTGPITFGQIDIAGGGKAFVSYTVRVGANARRGQAVNSAVPMYEGKVVGSTAKAVVVVTADADTDETSVIGRVFFDRDGDGWQDAADANGVRLQGGIDPSVYVANSTTVDRGDGAQAVPDASMPLAKGMALGSILARQSTDEPLQAHQVVVSLRVTDPVFSGETTLTTEEGARLTMASDGAVATALSGDAAHGLGAQDIRVQRSVTPVDGQFRVDYRITNHGVSEMGIPGVRLASPEGLVVQTDAYGRFHLEAIDAATRAHGRNFVLKLDPVSLPPGWRVTTRNPLVRRLTGGVSVRFDFGVGPVDAPAMGVVP
jgi:uncharacterized repeat protein (TIGR01451 family)